MKKTTTSLSYAARAHGTDERAEREATNLDKLGKAIQTTPYSRQWYLREAVFFVLLPFFRFCGDAGLRTVEPTSQEMNRFMLLRIVLYVKELGITYSNPLDKVRKGYGCMGYGTTRR